MREFFKDFRVSGEIAIRMDEHKGTWSARKGHIINSITAICDEYRRNGDNLTLRQLYYQLVSRDIIPNHDKVYKKLSSLKDNVVYAGMADWDIFEDRGRVPITTYFENDVAGALKRTAAWYNLNKQRGQPNHIEVWTEKDAISGILGKVTRPYTIDLVVNKGYSSSTAMYQAYCRFIKAIEKGQKVKILYFGDHDPSGLDMIRDIKERIMFMFCAGTQLEESMTNRIEKWWDDEELSLYDVAEMEGYEYVAKAIVEDNEKAWEMFAKGKRQMFMEYNDLFEVVHVGLTMEQIKQYNPPPNPAKITDPRAKAYVRKFGAVSWEVDALKPDVMRAIIKKAILERMDSVIYDKVIEDEKSDIGKITKMIKDISS